jgi:ribonuclease HI
MLIIADYLKMIIIRGMDKVIIFSDGASKGNPGPGGWGSIVLAKGTVKEIGGGENNTTNNRMELTAVIEALKLVKNESGEITINTDSKYIINGITGWVYGWQKNNWITKEKKEVLNRDLWEELIHVSNGKKIDWNYVGGHIGIEGNERCDAIATDFASGVKPELFSGDFKTYGLNLLNTKGTKEKVEKKSKNNLPAYAYVSLVNGVFHSDKTWAECEKRVKGKKGAKYKKVYSENEEKKAKEEWLG